MYSYLEKISISATLKRPDNATMWEYRGRKRPPFAAEPVMPMTFMVLACLATVTFAGAAHAEQAPLKPTVLITGSNRGIGFEFARQFSERDWKIIATVRNLSAATELRALADKDPDIVIETLDVTDHARINALAAKHSGRPIDILLLNAAQGPAGIRPLAKLDFDVGKRMFDVNAIGPLKMCQAFMTSVITSGKKQIVVMSSDSGSFVAGSQRPILYQSWALLILAYIIQFIPHATGGFRSTLLQIPRGIEEAALQLSQSRRRAVWNVLLPLLIPAVIASWSLVFLMSMRELPASLILSPNDFSTLTTCIWDRWEDARTAEASFYSLILLAATALPLWWLRFLPGTGRDEQPGT